MSASDITIRAGRPDDWDAVSRLVAQAFHVEPDAEVCGLEGSVYEPERGLLAEDDGALVGHASAYTRELTVPGAVLPAAHVTQVAVAPTHRRRRILTRTMHRQLREIRDAGCGWSTRRPPGPTSRRCTSPCEHTAPAGPAATRHGGGSCWPTRHRAAPGWDRLPTAAEVF